MELYEKGFVMSTALILVGVLIEGVKNWLELEKLLSILQVWTILGVAFGCILYAVQFGVSITGKLAVVWNGANGGAAGNNQAGGAAGNNQAGAGVAGNNLAGGGAAGNNQAGAGAAGNNQAGAGAAGNNQDGEGPAGNNQGEGVAAGNSQVSVGAVGAHASPWISSPVRQFGQSILRRGPVLSNCASGGGGGECEFCGYVHCRP